MIAQFETECAECGDTIRRGESISNVKGAWVHSECPDTPVPGRGGPVCPDCFTIHAGECL